MLATIKQYCAEKGVTMQIVRENIKKGVLRTIELPVFAEYEGKRIEVGKQKFIQPVVSTVEMSDIDRANHLASQASQNADIRHKLIELLLADEKEGKQLRSATDAYFEQRPAPEKVEYMEAKAKLRKLLLQETMTLYHEVMEITEK